MVMRKRGGIAVDFSGVESGGRAIPDDDYLLEVVSCEEKEGRESGALYLSWKYKVAEGTYKGATVYDNTSLSPQALWRLKRLLEAMGIQADGKMSLDINSFKGKRVLAQIANETYNGKEKPRVVEFLFGEASAGGGSSASANPFKKGSRVLFQYEGEDMIGVVSSVEGGKVIVAVTIDGEAEEWELDAAELSLAES